MAEVITVARPYAEAIFKLAVAENSLPRWSKMLQLAVDIADNASIKALIGNPVVSTKQLGDLFLQIGKGGFDEGARNFILLLTENNRAVILPQIKQLFEHLKAQHDGVLEAKIVSAYAVTNKQLEKLIEDLEQKFKRKIEARVSVDPELIGGIKVEIGDEVFDTSIRSKLENMAIALKS